jgi:hypothetical protein
MFCAVRSFAFVEESEQKLTTLAAMLPRPAEGSRKESNNKRSHSNSSCVSRHAEPECLDATAEFHKTFCCPVLDTPQIPDAKRCKLRINLIQEELDELKDAIAQNDLVEVADALAGRLSRCMN